MTAEPKALRPRRRIIPAEEAGAWTNGYEFLAAATRDAAQLRQNATEEFEAERRRGIETGLRDGTEAKAKLLAEAAAGIDRAIADAEPAIAATVLAAIERLLGDFDQHDLLARAVRHAIAQQRGSHRLTLRVASTEAAEITRRLGEAAGPGSALVDVVGDPQLAPDEAVLESEFGFVALGIGAQLAALRRGLCGGAGA